MAFLDSALAPFTMKGFYLLTWGTALGSNVWNMTSGVRAYRTLPRQTFGHLQSRLQPLFFSFQTITTSTLLLTHLYFHPALISSPLVEPHWATCEEGRQGLLILVSVATNLLNRVVIEPWTTSVMQERHRLERLEGKEYDEPNTSEAMGKLNKKFKTLHSLCSTLSMVSFLSLAGLGLAVSM